MADWAFVTYLHDDDLDRVRDAVIALATAAGRQPIAPVATRAQVAGEDVPWAIAGLAGIDGWTVLFTDPAELLLDGDPPLLAALTQRLGCVGFQHRVHDGTAQMLMEAGAVGQLAVSGDVPNDPTRARRYLADDGDAVYFRIVDVAVAAAAAERAGCGDVHGVTTPEPHGTGWFTNVVRDTRARELKWLEAEGVIVPGAPAPTMWKVGADRVVHALAAGREPPVSAAAVARALALVLGGEHADAITAGTPRLHLARGMAPDLTPSFALWFGVRAGLQN